MLDLLAEPAALLLRWLHVIAAIAWIGESFYFVALDNGLKTPKPGTAPAGVAGESWSVHGGGFYHKQKYLVSPATMPADLHWSKWKSYTTWLSGFALFALVYLLHPQVYLIDTRVAALSPAMAVLLAIGFLVVGWLVYDAACRLIGFRDRVLGVVVGLLVLALAIAATQLFSGRSAFLIVGATLATIMSANVFFVIIPGQKKMVAALARGEVPDPAYGKRGKQRSVHNTYFTLPVVFTMISNHNAGTYQHEHSWAILALIMLGGALVRQFFVLWHGGRRVWSLPLAGAVLVGMALLWTLPKPATPAVVEPAPEAAADPAASADAAPRPTATEPASTPAPAATSDAVQAVMQLHCNNCHGSKPTIMPVAPQGLVFDTPEQTRQHAARIHRQVVDLKAMPLGNMTGMTDADRDLIDRWYRALQAQ
ncbi:urate hydroxylase PuuD [Chiayiivirga flava]|uniref:Putative membrane protein n=1 Tax=Chiayiivirga flava TaxID=659595 RepID=A0A7W8G1A8_9GAMM|nr:urate hydroxylase PuuD [Chiayiivirga flava]MBB5209214.1 putative membrane protein [Chiayiivirga flava]